MSAKNSSSMSTLMSEIVNVRFIYHCATKFLKKLKMTSIKKENFPPRLVPNEEETAAERCSEKLVDLVVLLTTKLDNNVEDLRKELTDNINENIERFERVQQQQEEEYGEWGKKFHLLQLYDVCNLQKCILD